MITKMNGNKSIIGPGVFLEYAAPGVVSALSGAHSALLCFDPGHFRRMKKSITGQVVRGLSGEVWLCDGGIVVCGKTGIGAPAAVVLVEELIALGIKRIVTLGTAGALHDNLHAGDVVLCTEAFVDEGTSAHYIPGVSTGTPSLVLLSDVEAWLQLKNINLFRRKAWTTDAPYRETRQKLDKFLSLGADVVEMESSALYTVAVFRKIDLLSVFVIGDSISEGAWKPFFASTLVRQRLNFTGSLLMQMLVKESIERQTVRKNH